jgi:hypothetical protein
MSIKAEEDPASEDQQAKVAKTEGEDKSLFIFTRQNKLRLLS